MNEGKLVQITNMSTLNINHFCDSIQERIAWVVGNHSISIEIRAVRFIENIRQETRQQKDVTEDDFVQLNSKTRLIVMSVRDDDEFGR